MAAIHNQKGYTLILVMVIISVIMILGVALSGITLNANKQINMTDRQNKETDLAEMGITHYKEIINGLIIQAESLAKQDLLKLDFLQNTPQIDTINAAVSASLNSNFCNKFKELYEANDSKIPVTVENGDQYEIQPKVFETVCTNNTKVVQVKFDSIGITSGSSKPVTLQVTFNIKQNPFNVIPKTVGSNFTLLNSDDSEIITDPLSKLNKLLNLIILLKLNIPTVLNVTNTIHLPATFKITDSSDTLLSILGNIDVSTFGLNGASGITSLIVNGNVKFDTFTVNGNPPTGTNLFASGDVFIPNTAILNGQTLNVCVLGDIYLFSNQTPPYQLPEASSIDDRNTANTSTIVNKCTQGHWGISPNGGVDVLYN